MIAPLVLLHPELALAALFASYLLHGIHELVILRKLGIVDFLGLVLDLFLVHLLTCHANMINDHASHAPGHLAHGAIVDSFAICLLEETVVAVLCRALCETLFVTQLFVLKSLESISLLLCEQLLHQDRLQPRQA